jgi:hypothetical protein
LTAEQIVARARYLAGETASDQLDEFVRDAAAQCATIYYRLEYPQGGDDPTAPDPASRWSKPGSNFVNVTADCVAGIAWCSGFDRLQPERAGRVWGGRLNCDSILIEANEYGACFEFLEAPEPGAIVVFGSIDYNRDGERDRIGHIGIVTDVPAEWDRAARECWEALGVVDIAGRSGRANMRTSGLTWWGNDRQGVAKDSKFLRSLMEP